MHSTRSLSAYLLIAITLLLSACTTQSYTQLRTVESVDLNRYVGAWYEIALLPNYFQRMCATDTQARYRASDDRILVTNRCRKSDGMVESIAGFAKVLEDSNNTKLRVTFFRPFYGNYWILALGPDYDWALVGEPNRKYGWVLARRPQMDDATLNAILDKAQSLGYDRSQFKKTPQTQPLD